jgi:hypothetical protein
LHDALVADGAGDDIDVSGRNGQPKLAPLICANAGWLASHADHSTGEWLSGRSTRDTTGDFARLREGAAAAQCQQQQ